MRSIAVINQKGGCGKTITAINLSAFLAREGRKVLLVDMDPQGHTTIGLQTDSAQPVKTISDVLLREAGAEKVTMSDVTRPVLANLDLIPADVMLSGVSEKLAAVFGREYKLSWALDEVRNRYHYAIIDCPPNIGFLTFNALMACTEAIIPMDPSFFSLHGIAKLLETLDVLSRKTGHAIEAQALITLYTGRMEFVKEVVEDIRKHMGHRVFDTIIRFSVKLAEAASHGLPICEYSKRCTGFADYKLLAREVLQQEAEKPVGESLEEGEEGERAWERVPDELNIPSAPIRTKEGVIFTLEAPEARCVQLTGDFNQWVSDGCEMQFSNGVWMKMLALSPGRYRYRYIVDGRWQPDPLNTLAEPSPYGDLDSVVVLEDNQ